MFVCISTLFQFKFNQEKFHMQGVHSYANKEHYVDHTDSYLSCIYIHHDLVPRSSPLSVSLEEMYCHIEK